MICLKALDVDGMDSLCRLGLSVKLKAVIQMKKKKMKTIIRAES
jgi:hypothetical protein